MIDSQLAADILMGIIGLLSLAGLFGVAAAFWSLGRSAYRKE